MTLQSRVQAMVGVGVLAIAATFIGVHEGEVRKTYRDPVGIPTACFGQTGASIKYGQTFTAGECTGMLVQSTRQAMQAVDHCVPGLPEGPRIAFTSLTFNVGAGAFCKSRMASLARAGRLPEACAQLSRWVYAGGKVLPGLVRRRADERRVCERGTV